MSALGRLRTHKVKTIPQARRLQLYAQQNFLALRVLTYCHQRHAC